LRAGGPDHPKGETIVLRIVLLCLAVGFASGCATVTRGSSQAWTVETDPAGADVALSNGERCKTPCTLKLRRKYGFTVDISKEGYEPVRTEVVSQMSGAGGTALAGNIILGGLIGAGIDAGSGAAKDLRPNPLSVKLNPVVDAASAAPAAAAQPADEPPVDDSFEAPAENEAD
jgi:hypothetical protein